MLRLTAENLSHRSSLFRYAYFLLSGVRYKTHAAWTREGEPNPFVRPARKSRETNRAEMSEVFEMQNPDLRFWRPAPIPKDCCPNDQALSCALPARPAAPTRTPSRRSPTNMTFVA
jgi:hypothetical protein